MITFQNATNCMFSIGNFFDCCCMFSIYLEFLVLAVTEKFLGKEDQFGSFCTFVAKYALIKIAITFDRLNRFYRMIACFKGKDICFNTTTYLTIIKKLA